MTTIVLFAALALAGIGPQTPDSPPPPPNAPATKPPASENVVGGVVVNGARAPVETAIDRRSYSVAGDLMAKTGSISDVLRNIPSVQVDLQGNLSLRGDPNVTILVDGKPSSQFSPETQAQMLQALPAEQIDRVEVITNPSAEFRADGTGGIINLITKTAKGVGRTGSVRVQAGTGSRATLSATAGYNSNRLSTTADAVYQTIGIVQSSLERHSVDASQDTTAVHGSQVIASGHVGADYDLDARTRLSGALRFTYYHADLPSADRLVRDGAGPPVPVFSRLSDTFQTGHNGEASVIVRRRYADGNDITLNATYNGNQGATGRVDELTPSSLADPVRTDEVDRANFNRRSMFTTDYQRPLGPAKLKLGYDFEYTDNFVEHHGGSGTPGGAIMPDPAQTDNFADDETHNQAYVTYERTFGKLQSLFGLRGETVGLALDQRGRHIRSSPDYNRLYPTLHLGYDLTGGRRLTASYSKRVVRPQPVELDPFRYLATPALVLSGNPDLTPQETDSYELGYEDHNGPANVMATLYYRRTNNAFTNVYSDLGNGVLLQQRGNAGYQANGGLELVLADKLTPKLSYNLSADSYWAELSAPRLGFIQTRSAITGFGRANLNWQVTPKDLFQFNLFANGKSLIPQGYAAPTISGNIGYRHTINNKVSWMLVVQDPFHSLKNRLVLDVSGGADRRITESNSRVAVLTLVWNFSGKPPAANFDFAPGGGEGSPQ